MTLISLQIKAILRIQTQRDHLEDISNLGKQLRRIQTSIKINFINLDLSISSPRIQNQMPFLHRLIQHNIRYPFSLTVFLKDSLS